MPEMTPAKMVEKAIKLERKASELRAKARAQEFSGPIIIPDVSFTPQPLFSGNGRAVACTIKITSVADDREAFFESIAVFTAWLALRSGQEINTREGFLFL